MKRTHMSIEKAESGGEINIVMTEEQQHAMTTRAGEEWSAA